MQTFEVDVGGKTYEVDAPDAKTAWQWANVTHQQKTAKAAAVLAADREKYSPTAGMSGAEKFLAGAGKAFTDMGRGVSQIFGGTSTDDVEESRRLDAPLMKTGAGMAGNITGNVAAALPTAFIPGVNTVTGGALVGAGLSAMQPVGQNESRLQNAAIGGATGAALPAAMSGYRAARAALYDPLAGQGRVLGGALARSSGDRAQELARTLRSSQGAATPGVNLSAGTRSGNEGISALEDAIRSQLPSGELARTGQINRNALADALRGVGGSPEQIAAAEATREGAAQTLYGLSEATPCAKVWHRKRNKLRQD